MKLASLGTITTINPPGPQKGRLAVDDLVDFIPMASVKEDGSMEVLEQRKYGEVSSGFTPFMRNDILVAKITPCFENNKIALASVSTDYAFGSTEFHVVRCNSKMLNPKYLVHILRHDYVRILGERKMTGSGGQRRVPQYFLDELQLPLPDLVEQERISSLLEKADELRLRLLNGAARTNELLACLRDRAFRGEL
ncbi:restriction endonuclease subunit S [Bradyrhizobium sp. AUGA SZCCT0160]|uniref:restriction endonuclease subunit S n=1 Tax=Bradyrhizobium sp. AUGA SZCCT0160 TaxID=2807662 RepID=UPI001BA90818|nr:restriction endonuclease subunit S [Bradyrhizobium sp. AUGA SZCCT0160]MBR1191484.1 restriction endonuclease subunit S [Bradyrhizobium sp. AUGA SZCCT0160]